MAVGVKVTTFPAALVASTTMFDGQVTTGAMVSRTVTVKVQVLVFSAASYAVTVTVVVPMGKTEPEAGEAVTVGLASTTSVALTVKSTTLPAELVASTVMLVEHVTTGAVVSRTVTVKVQMFVFRLAS